MINEVFALNAKHLRTGIGGALPDAYLDFDSAKEMARSLAGSGNAAQYKEVEPSDANPDEEILFSAEDGTYKYEVLRLRIAY